MVSPLHCSFCMRSEAEVRKLVAGGGGGYICDACVAIAARIMVDADPRADTRGRLARLRSRLRAFVRGGRGQPLSRAASAV